MTQRKCRLFLVDAFTRERFCGNPAAVVLDADVLEEQEMRRIARELAGFEVAFVLGSDSPDYDVELRFFSPRREVGFVGHATVAAHYVRAMADGVPRGKVRQKSAAGIVGVEVSGKAPNLRVTIDQTPATFGPIVPEERLGPVLDALGISSSSLHPACPVQVMSTANSRLLLGLQSPDTLDSLQPKMEQLIHLTSHVGAYGVIGLVLLLGLKWQTLAALHHHDEEMTHKGQVPDHDCALCVYASMATAAIGSAGWQLTISLFAAVWFTRRVSVRRAAVRFHNSRAPPASPV